MVTYKEYHATMKTGRYVEVKLEPNEAKTTQYLILPVYLNPKNWKEGEEADYEENLRREFKQAIDEELIKACLKRMTMIKTDEIWRDPLEKQMLYIDDEAKRRASTELEELHFNNIRRTPQRKEAMFQKYKNIILKRKAYEQKKLELAEKKQLKFEQIRFQQMLKEVEMDLREKNFEKGVDLSEEVIHQQAEEIVAKALLEDLTVLRSKGIADAEIAVQQEVQESKADEVVEPELRRSTRLKRKGTTQVQSKQGAEISRKTGENKPRKKRLITLEEKERSEKEEEIRLKNLKIAFLEMVELAMVENYKLRRREGESNIDINLMRIQQEVSIAELLNITLKEVDIYHADEGRSKPVIENWDIESRDTSDDEETIAEYKRIEGLKSRALQLGLKKSQQQKQKSEQQEEVQTPAEPLIRQFYVAYQTLYENMRRSPEWNISWKRFDELSRTSVSKLTLEERSYYEMMKRIYVKVQKLTDKRAYLAKDTAEVVFAHKMIAATLHLQLVLIPEALSEEAVLLSSEIMNERIMLEKQIEEAIKVSEIELGDEERWILRQLKQVYSQYKKILADKFAEQTGSKHQGVVNSDEKNSSSDDNQTLSKFLLKQKKSNEKQKAEVRRQGADNPESEQLMKQNHNLVICAQPQAEKSRIQEFCDAYIVMDRKVLRGSSEAVDEAWIDGLMNIPTSDLTGAEAVYARMLKPLVEEFKQQRQSEKQTVGTETVTEKENLGAEFEKELAEALNESQATEILAEFEEEIEEVNSADKQLEVVGGSEIEVDVPHIGDGNIQGAANLEERREQFEEGEENYDRLKFISLERQQKMKQFEEVQFVIERTVEEAVDTYFGVRAAFDKLGWSSLLNIEGKYYPDLIKEFYANWSFNSKQAVDAKGTSYIRGIHIEMTKVKLGDLLGVSAEDKVMGAYSSINFSKERVRTQLHIEAEPRDRNSDRNRVKYCFPTAYPRVKVLALLISTNLAPRMRSRSECRECDLVFLYKMLIQKDRELYNLPAEILFQINWCFRRGGHLIFPILISRFLERYYPELIPAEEDETPENCKIPDMSDVVNEDSLGRLSLVKREDVWYNNKIEDGISYDPEHIRYHAGAVLLRAELSQSSESGRNSVPLGDPLMQDNMQWEGPAVEEEASQGNAQAVNLEVFKADIVKEMNDMADKLRADVNNSLNESVNQMKNLKDEMVIEVRNIVRDLKKEMLDTLLQGVGGVNRNLDNMGELIAMTREGCGALTGYAQEIDTRIRMFSDEAREREERLQEEINAKMDENRRYLQDALHSIHDNQQLGFQGVVLKDEQYWKKFLDWDAWNKRLFKGKPGQKDLLPEDSEEELEEDKGNADE